MNKNKITVTLPLEEFEKLSMAEEEIKNTDLDKDIKYNSDYINVLCNDVVGGDVRFDEADSFYFFKTKLGKYVLDKIKSGEYK